MDLFAWVLVNIFNLGGHCLFTSKLCGDYFGKLNLNSWVLSLGFLCDFQYFDRIAVESGASDFDQLSCYNYLFMYYIISRSFVSDAIELKLQENLAEVPSSQFPCSSN